MQLEIADCKLEFVLENISHTVSQPNETMRAVARIFRQLSENSIRTSDGMVSWNAPASSLHTGRTHSGPAGPQLYDGTSGIVLFLGAYYLATKSPDALDLTLRSAARLRFDLKQMSAGGLQNPEPVAGTGGLTGMTSASYALVRLADWLKMPEFFESAREVANALTPQQILREERLDIMGGCAGTLLALLSFVEEVTAREIDSGMAMDLALLCGRRLIESRTHQGSGLRSWTTVDSRISGFALGAPGIAYALLRLFQCTGRQEFRDAAIEAFALERELLSSRLHGLADPHSENLVRWHSWCHGPPGAALSYLLSTVATNSNSLHYSLEEALMNTRALPESPVDHLCCGNFGRVEIMLTAGSLLGRLQLTEHARELTRQVLSRAATSGFCFQPLNGHPPPHPSSARNPSLFLGLSGVGYTLLRLNYPDLFPSALFLESQS